MGDARGGFEFKILDKLKALIADSDFERIKRLDRARTGDATRKRYSSRYTDAVIPPGYSEKEFDPVKYELEQLSDEAGPEEIDAIAAKLTTEAEVGVGLHAIQFDTRLT